MRVGTAEAQKSQTLAWYPRFCFSLCNLIPNNWCCWVWLVLVSPSHRRYFVKGVQEVGFVSRVSAKHSLASVTLQLASFINTDRIGLFPTLKNFKLQIVGSLKQRILPLWSYGFCFRVVWWEFINLECLPLILVGIFKI